MPNLNPETARTIDRLFGAPEALDTADAVTVGLILEYIRLQPSVNRRDVLALTAIAELSTTDPDLARSLMDELISLVK
jgi:hypothetical protein